VEEVTAARAADRVGERVEVLLETVDGADGEGRAEHQGPEVDGSTRLTGLPAGARVGDLVAATVVDSDGVDLVAVPG
jgi:ribosomal protein S12 methylthiotransferase